ncbi:GrpB family protein [Planomicrobium okeanokoites]|uniref:GrpB family protein n=1 Tax=Planomicrobium okeanokoites TaxID=244 RepID=A0ABV7KKJ6_PLAOK|nr:GrpB family protein [Planomicrobium okeanokoites]TAA68881.1 GrpB family protein [Planomicrobium okeanokoites]
MRKVTVTDYQPEWRQQFQLAAKELRELFGAECIEIHHIGSTSIEGMAAKPVIDLMPVVREIEVVDGLISEMEKRGYESKGENGLPGRRYFQRGGDERIHHVHIYAAGNPEIDRHLAFRNYLRENPQEAEEYGILKKKLAHDFPYDIEQYIAGKERLVARIEKNARGET